MEPTVFQVSDSPMTHVAVARYLSAANESKPFVLDVSIVVDSPDPDDQIEYSETTSYESQDLRDFDFHFFGKAQAERFYKKALRAVNA